VALIRSKEKSGPSRKRDVWRTVWYIPVVSIGTSPDGIGFFAEEEMSERLGSPDQVIEIDRVQVLKNL